MGVIWVSWWGRGVVKEIMGFRELSPKFGAEKGGRFMPGKSASPV